MSNDPALRAANGPPVRTYTIRDVLLGNALWFVVGFAVCAFVVARW